MGPHMHAMKNNDLGCLSGSMKFGSGQLTMTSIGG
jgi:hypothetical protein